MIRNLILVSLALTACASDDSSCEQAAAHIAACFPEHVTPPVCDPETADAVAEMSCDELAGWDGKADNPWCIWTPWLCVGDGGTSSTSGRKIEVAVDECLSGTGCPAVHSASCGLVTLHDDNNKQIARGFSTGGGRVTFEGIDPGTYTVKVHHRDGSLAHMMVSDYTNETAKAVQEIELGSGSAPWARFNLVTGSAAQITQCAEARGDVDFTNAAGVDLDPEEMEWTWLVELETAGAVMQTTRPLFFHPDTNIVRFRLLSKGSHTIRYIRMDIPSYARELNPDYAKLRRDYSTDETIEKSITVTSSQIGTEIDFTHVIVDPLAN